VRSVDAQSRRTTVLFEIVAVADRYEQDQAPATSLERLKDLIKAEDKVGQAGWVFPPAPERSALLELAGRVLAWLEADAEAEQKR
jgi:hypothetical protein